MTSSVADVLRALADLAPAPPERAVDVTKGGQPMVWLDEPDRCPRGTVADRLAALDALHRDERILRRGWGVVAGTAALDGGDRRQRVRLPLVVEPVRLERAGRAYRLVPAGDIEVTPLLDDRGLAAAVERTPGLGRPEWLRAVGTAALLLEVARKAGLPAGGTAPDDEPARPPADGLRVYRRAVLYTVRDAYGVALGDSLRAWARRPGIAGTALGAVYGERPAGAPDTGPVRSPLPLTHAQREVVRRARTEPLTVVCGPPGSGKSHTVVAAALDVVDRGGSVLIATQSPHAADVLATFLDRYPGPTPVLFGDAERRAAIAVALGEGAAAAVDAATLRADEREVAAAAAALDTVTEAVRAALELEERAASLDRWAPLLPALEAAVPGAFADSTDLAAAARRLDGEPATGWWDRLRARRFRRSLGAAPDVPAERVRAALDAAAARRAAARLHAGGGTDLTPSWAALAEARDRLAAAVGVAMRGRTRAARRWDAAARRAAGELASALRAGRNRRRELLAGLDGPALVRALPLWIGTVADVEDLLPPTPHLFDLVVIDEASHTDQIRAAPLLARARRALVVGDPRQLRFVSFVADVDVAATLARHGVDERLDVRRVSAYDLAARSAPVTWLDVHFRCAPHLIGFSARRFYDGRLALATRHPRTEAADVIEVVRTADPADEVRAAVAAVRRLAAEGVRGIGMVTPFRAQADALEAALVAAFPLDEIEALGLRVGTVHGFQGSEADVVICSLGVADGDPAGRHRFLAEPTLFNVMITRARHRMVVLTSRPAPPGLVGDYLRYADAPPTPPADTERPAGWAGELAEHLGRLGHRVRAGYRSGRWTIDLVVGELGLFCAVHPDGADAHIARHEELTRAGWRLTDAFPSRWSGDPVKAALDLATSLDPSGGPPLPP